MSGASGYDSYCTKEAVPMEPFGEEGEAEQFLDKGAGTGNPIGVH